MPESHDLLLAFQLAGHELVDLRHVADLVEHDHHALVRTTVERSSQGTDRGGTRGVEVAQGGDHHERGEGRGIESVVGMQHQADVEGSDHGLRGLLTPEHPEEVACNGAVRVGRDEILALAMPVEGGDQGRRLRDEANRLADVGFGRVVVRLGIEERQRGHESLDGVHRGRVGGRRLHHVEDAGGQLVLRPKLLLEGLEFGGVRQPAVPEQEGRLLEGRVPRKRIDVDADVLENAPLTVDERHLSLGGDGVDEPLIELLAADRGHGADSVLSMTIVFSLTPDPLRPGPAEFAGPNSVGPTGADLNGSIHSSA